MNELIGMSKQRIRNAELYLDALLHILNGHLFLELVFKIAK